MSCLYKNRTEGLDILRSQGAKFLENIYESKSPVNEYIFTHDALFINKVSGNSVVQLMRSCTGKNEIYSKVQKGHNSLILDKPACKMKVFNNQPERVISNWLFNFGCLIIL